jgi:hypothetical protein
VNGTLKCQIATFRRGIRTKPSSLFQTFLGTWFLGSLPFLDSAPPYYSKKLHSLTIWKSKSQGFKSTTNDLHNWPMQKKKNMVTLLWYFAYEKCQLIIRSIIKVVCNSLETVEKVSDKVAKICSWLAVYLKIIEHIKT